MMAWMSTMHTVKRVKYGEQDMWLVHRDEYHRIMFLRYLEEQKQAPLPLTTWQRFVRWVRRKSASAHQKENEIEILTYCTPPSTLNLEKKIR